MAIYNVTLDGGILKIGFGDSAQNDAIVREVEGKLAEMNLSGGEVIKVNGPASLPVAMVLAHRLGHLYQAVACFDPKLGKYVVAIAHGDKYAVGGLID